MAVTCLLPEGQARKGMSLAVCQGGSQLEGGWGRSPPASCASQGLLLAEPDRKLEAAEPESYGFCQSLSAQTGGTGTVPSTLTM